MDTKRIYLIIMLMLLSPHLEYAWGQEANVIRYFPEKRLAIVDQGMQHGLKMGTDLTIFRETYGDFEAIAKVKVIKLVNKYSVVKIISFASEKDVKVGDIAASSRDSLIFPELTQQSVDKTIINSANKQYRSKSNILPWSLIGLGLASAAIAGYMHYEANNNYDQYIAATNPNDATKYREQVENFQQWRNVSLIGTGVSTLTGIVLFLTKKKQPHTFHTKGYQGSKKSICLVPCYYPHKIGLGFKMYF